MSTVPTDPSVPSAAADPVGMAVRPAARGDRIVLPLRTTTVRRLTGRSVGAHWGDPTLLAPFTDRVGAVVVADPDGAGTDPRPEAEVWYGAHPRHPSWVEDPDGPRRADTLPAVERPSFLVKLLAAGGPLSIQVHPDAATARRQWDADESAGVPRDAPDRRSADAAPKPELVRALGPFRALCGLRRASVSRALLTAVAPSGAEPLLELLAHGDAGLGPAVATVLRADRTLRTTLLDAVIRGAREVVDADAADPAVLRLARLALDLVARFPDDAGVLVALLLEDVDLAPGEALFVAPGTPHAYLSGLAVEVMAPSDNVLRGGMTTKHVDVEAFLEVLDPRAVGAPRVGMLARRVDGSRPGHDGPGWQRHIAPTDAFVVDEARLGGTLRLERSGRGPAVLLCVEGDARVVATDGSEAALGPGGAVLLDAGLGPVTVQGTGLVLHVSPAVRVPTSG